MSKSIIDYLEKAKYEGLTELEKNELAKLQLKEEEDDEVK